MAAVAVAVAVAAFHARSDLIVLMHPQNLYKKTEDPFSKHSSVPAIKDCIPMKRIKQLKFRQASNRKYTLSSPLQAICEASIIMSKACCLPHNHDCVHYDLIVPKSVANGPSLEALVFRYSYLKEDFTNI